VFKNLKSKINKETTQQEIKPDLPLSFWDSDKKFNSLYNKISKNTLVDKNRCHILYQLAHQVFGISGDVAEVGVYKGGTARLLAEIFDSKKTLHLFDTFSGIPQSDAPLTDHHKKGDFGDVSFDEVKNFLSNCKNVHFYKGIFPTTANSTVDRFFSFVHVDVDVYKSAIDCCNFFYDKMKQGGIIIFDDYGWQSCPGVKKAVDEFFLDKLEYPCYLPTGQSVVIKI